MKKVNNNIFWLIFTTSILIGCAHKKTVNNYSSYFNDFTFYRDSTFSYEKVGLGHFYLYSRGKWYKSNKNLILNSNLKYLHLNCSRSDKDYAENNTARVILLSTTDNSECNYYSYLYDQNDSILVDPIQPYVDSLFNHSLPLDTMIKHRRSVDLPYLFNLTTKGDSVYFGIEKDPLYSRDYKASLSRIFTNKVSIRNSKDTLHVKINIVDSLFNYQVFNDSAIHVSKFKTKKMSNQVHPYINIQ